MDKDLKRFIRDALMLFAIDIILMRNPSADRVDLMVSDVVDQVETFIENKE